MKDQAPRYATLLYEVLPKLNISVAEYFYLDMIHKLSYQRWCSKSLESCARDMRISRRGLINMKNRMLERGLIEKNQRGHVKVTAKYTEVAVNKVHQQDPQGVHKVPKLVNKVHSKGAQSSLIENNKRITENIYNKGKFSKNKEKLRAALKTGDFSGFKSKQARSH